MIITIDGPASAGKGTLASTLAGIYHLAYLTPAWFIVPLDLTFV